MIDESGYMALKRIKIKQAMTFCVMLCFLGACQGDSGTEKKVKFQIPWPTAKGKYQIQEVELKTLSHPQKLEGSAAKVLLNSRYKRSDGLISPSFDLRFIERDSVFIPANSSSLQAATVYAHMEKLQELDQKAGIEKLLPRPRNVGVNAEVIFPGGEKPAKNNAAYIPSSDVFVIVPYDQENLPITLNAGVIAHEYFHAIFQHAVMKDLDKKSEYEEFLLQAWDEGMADLWGWIYTGDVSFISHSLPQFAKGRVLDEGAYGIPQDIKLQKLLDEMSEKEKRRQIYTVGSFYSRLLYQVAKNAGHADNKEGRQKFAKVFIKSLNRLKDQMDSKEIGADLIVKAFAEEAPQTFKKSCSSFSTSFKKETLVSLGCDE